MECRKLEITLVSADNLPNIRTFGEMKVYAEVSINDEKKTSKKTTVDKFRGTNPRWNCLVDYTLYEPSIREPGLQLVVKLYCERTLGDKCVGEVRLAVNALFENGKIGDENERIYAVEDGNLDILYRFGDVFMVPKPPAWKKALEVVKAVIIHGTWFYLTGDTGF